LGAPTFVPSTGSLTLAARKERYRAATVREPVPVWFRLRRVRESVPLGRSLIRRRSVNRWNLATHRPQMRRQLAAVVYGVK
jgi:hypothetical protein